MGHFFDPQKDTFVLRALDKKIIIQQNDIKIDIDGFYKIHFIFNFSITPIRDVPLPDLNIYPNPVKNKIDIVNPKEYRLHHYRLYSLIGVLIQEGKINGNKIEITNSLSNGIYLLQISTKDNKMKTIKVLFDL